MSMSFEVANIYVKAGEDALKSNDKEKAKALYKKAAEEFLKQYNCATNEADEKLILENYNYYRSLTENLTKEPKIREDKKQINQTHSKITFDDVAGMHELKKELEISIIWPLIYADKIKNYIKMSYNGILLYGPPGCGKTFIAKSVAGEAGKISKRNIAFYSAKSSDILNKYVGESESNLKNYFESAANNSPSILFFDEIDALGGERDGQSKYCDNLVNEFLSDFEILENKLVLIIGATNSPWKVDPALLRSGRIGKSILVPPPDLEARKEIYKLHLKNRKLNNNINYDELANISANYSSSDIEQICNEAGRTAFERSLSSNGLGITQSDLIDATKKNKGSLLKWCIKAKAQLTDIYTNELKRDIPYEFIDLVKLIEKIEAEKKDDLNYIH